MSKPAKMEISDKKDKVRFAFAPSFLFPFLLLASLHRKMYPKKELLFYPGLKQNTVRIASKQAISLAN